MGNGGVRGKSMDVALTAASTQTEPTNAKTADIRDTHHRTRLTHHTRTL